MQLVVDAKLLEEAHDFILGDKLIHFIDVLTIIIGILQEQSMNAFMYFVDVIILAVEYLL